MRSSSSSTRTWSSPFTLCLSTLVLLLLSLSLITPTTAQTHNCYSCIQKTIPTIGNCTSFTPVQYTTIDKLIHGNELFNTTSDFRKGDPPAFQCVTALMWDVVHYKASFWSKCLEPAKACSWAEMMQYLEIIPKIASIYGVQNPPASILIDAPA
ncbi:hypothetical protein BGX23_005877 [Mortierella sp. AD031]|nr:hypothetical protein BGX23_005877 [Mortierella sp. AD031]